MAIIQQDIELLCKDLQEAAEANGWEQDKWLSYCMVLNSFYAYRVCTVRSKVQVERKDFFSMPARQQDLLKRPPFNYLDRFQAVEEAIEVNAICARAVLRTGLKLVRLEHLMDKYVVDQDGNEQPLFFDAVTKTPCIPGLQSSGDQLNPSRVTWLIMYLAREWSGTSNNVDERTQCHQPILDFLENWYANVPRADRDAIKILNPGCGTGRLPLDISLLGFNTTGNELSEYMRLGATHMLNEASKVGEFSIYPFAHIGRDHLTLADRMQCCSVPNIVATDEQAKARSTAASDSHDFSKRLRLESGDFSIVYNQKEYKEYFDVVVMLFFLDIAKNPLAFFEAVANCVKPNGLWINLGPLKWQRDLPPQHFGTKSLGVMAGPSPGQFMPTQQDILALLSHYGFELVHSEQNRPGICYASDPNATTVEIFRPCFWVARKLPVAEL